MKKIVLLRNSSRRCQCLAHHLVYTLHSGVSSPPHLLSQALVILPEAFSGHKGMPSPQEQGGSPRELAGLGAASQPMKQGVGGWIPQLPHHLGATILRHVLYSLQGPRWNQAWVFLHYQPITSSISCFLYSHFLIPLSTLSQIKPFIPKPLSRSLILEKVREELKGSLRSVSENSRSMSSLVRLFSSYSLIHSDTLIRHRLLVNDQGSRR